jgi:hypothetical protein
MDEQYRAMVDFLVAEGTDKVPHTQKSFLAHLIGVYRDLEAWGYGKHVCRAGLFHSIYGTEPFQEFKLSLERRGEVRELIGERAERLAYLNSAMTRTTFDEAIQQDEGPHTMVDRFTGAEVEFTPDEFEDLCTVHLCDWLEQVERYEEWGSRRAAFRRLAEMLGGVAMESYEKVFAREPSPHFSLPDGRSAQ